MENLEDKIDEEFNDIIKRSAYEKVAQNGPCQAASWPGSGHGPKWPEKDIKKSIIFNLTYLIIILINNI